MIMVVVLMPFTRFVVGVLRAVTVFLALTLAVVMVMMVVHYIVFSRLFLVTFGVKVTRRTAQCGADQRTFHIVAGSTADYAAYGSPHNRCFSPVGHTGMSRRSQY